MQDTNSIYQSISNRSIRLLSLKPGFPSETIECFLLTVENVEDAPPYEAISYVWGTELAEDPIVCNGVATTVTGNLFDALKHLRPFPNWDSVIPWSAKHPLHSSRRPVWSGFARNRNEQRENVNALRTWVWLDALCINQTDVEERATQVKMMRRIYEQAATVKIWLGKGDRISLSSVGSSHIGRYGSVPVVLSFIAQALRNIPVGRNRLASIRPAEDSTHRNAAYGFPAPSAMEWSTVRTFFANPWFQRVWVVQEVVLAKNAVVILGDWEIQWPALGQAACWFQAKGYALPPASKYQPARLYDLLPIAAAAGTWIMCMVPDHKLPLLELLQDFRNRSATQPSDKVFAALGLAEEVSDLVKSHGRSLRASDLLEVDYRKPIKDIYRDMARFLIIEHGDLLILSHASEPSRTQQLSWPSWVPDWRSPKATSEFPSRQNANAYNADGGEPLAIGMASDEDSIVLQGIKVDVISAYSDKLKSYGFGSKTYQEERDFVKAAWSLLPKTSAPDRSNRAKATETLHSFILTLTAGLNNDSTPVEMGSSLYRDAGNWFAEHLDVNIAAITTIDRLKSALPSDVDSGRFHQAFVRACTDRRFFVTEGGRMGIGPDTMKEGDNIIILFGGKVPYVLRLSGSRHRFIGECYVPGLMNGESVQQWRAMSREQVVFELY